MVGIELFNNTILLGIRVPISEMSVLELILGAITVAACIILWLFRMLVAAGLRNEKFWPDNGLLLNNKGLWEILFHNPYPVKAKEFKAHLIVYRVSFVIFFCSVITMILMRSFS